MGATDLILWHNINAEKMQHYSEGARSWSPSAVQSISPGPSRSQWLCCWTWCAESCQWLRAQLWSPARGWSCVPALPSYWCTHLEASLRGDWWHSWIVRQQGLTTAPQPALRASAIIPYPSWSHVGTNKHLLPTHHVPVNTTPVSSTTLCLQSILY